MNNIQDATSKYGMKMKFFEDAILKLPQASKAIIYD